MTRAISVRFAARPARPRSVAKYQKYQNPASRAGASGVVEAAMSWIRYPFTATTPAQRDGHSAAATHAARPPQSYPAYVARSIPSASCSSTRSAPRAACCPERPASLRERVGPCPRR